MFVKYLILCKKKYKNLKNLLRLILKLDNIIIVKEVKQNDGRK